MINPCFCRKISLRTQVDQLGLEDRLQLILATRKTLVADEDIVRPLYFFGGPIKGGGDWQEPACEFFIRRNEEVGLAVPRRWSDNHPLLPYQAFGEDQAFKRQTLWERHYLARAALWGCVVFWLPCQSKTDPRTDGQPYGRDTYGELGRWSERMAKNPTLKVVIGAEPDFPGLDVISCNINEDVGYHFPIHSTLEETLEQAILRSRQ